MDASGAACTATFWAGLGASSAMNGGKVDLFNRRTSCRLPESTIKYNQNTQNSLLDSNILLTFYSLWVGNQLPLLSPSLPGWLHCRLPHKIKFSLHQKIFKNCMQQPRTNRASKRFLYFSPVGPSKPVTLHADFEKNGMCYPKWCPPAPSRPRVRMTCQRMQARFWWKEKSG